jgi:hypothetical protein
MTMTNHAFFFLIALGGGCEPKRPVGYPAPNRNCTPEQRQESFDCQFYGFEFQSKKSHVLTPDDYTGGYAGGDKTLCGCNTKLLGFVDEARSQGFEPIIEEPCQCTRTR